ncbi:MAG: hypothetical protein CM15mP120_23440 [Pseudomonadota bacterium]|nr:MAG: hypothetical protein CM15mP120_23440 [Pseudomonadota bacterium]
MRIGCARLRLKLDPNLSPVELINTASELLSQFTQMTCLITTPDVTKAILRQLEFLRLDDERVLVILVLNDRDVQNRVIHLDKSFSDQELVQAANLLNQEFGGRPLVEMREAVMTSMRADRERMDEVLQSALSMAEGALPADQSNSEEQELVVSGERRLLDFTADTTLRVPCSTRSRARVECCICWINVSKAVACNCILAKNPAIDPWVTCLWLPHPTKSTANWLACWASLGQPVWTTKM